LVPGAVDRGGRATVVVLRTVPADPGVGLRKRWVLPSWTTAAEPILDRGAQRAVGPMFARRDHADRSLASRHPSGAGDRGGVA
jgi:hypothetical protein